MKKITDLVLDFLAHKYVDSTTLTYCRTSCIQLKLVRVRRQILSVC